VVGSSRSASCKATARRSALQKQSRRERIDLCFSTWVRGLTMADRRLADRSCACPSNLEERRRGPAVPPLSQARYRGNQPKPVFVRGFCATFGLLAATRHRSYLRPATERTPAKRHARSRFVFFTFQTANSVSSVCEHDRKPDRDRNDITGAKNRPPKGTGGPRLGSVDKGWCCHERRLNDSESS
jgi:hypothetical protein